MKERNGRVTHGMGMAWAWWRCTVMQWRARIAPRRSWWSDDDRARGPDQWEEAH